MPSVCAPPPVAAPSGSSSSEGVARLLKTVASYQESIERAAEIWQTNLACLTRAIHAQHLAACLPMPADAQRVPQRRRL